MRHVPATVDTECRPLNEAWEKYAASLLHPENGILVEDTDKALNWDAFLGRSVPAETAQRGYVATKQDTADLLRLPEHGIKLRDLAELWQIEPLREHFMLRGDDVHEPPAASCSTLLASGGPAGKMLCDALLSIPKSSSHWSVRALLQNAALLADTDFSFRKWLEREIGILGEKEFPPSDFRTMVIVTEPSGGISQVTIEQALQRIIGRVFHRASAPVAAHMICDWQLGLWLDNRIAVFDLYPYDAHHRRFVAQCPELPEGQEEFTRWWHAQPSCSDLPPRIATACMACELPATSN